MNSHANSNSNINKNNDKNDSGNNFKLEAVLTKHCTNTLKI